MCGVYNCTYIRHMAEFTYFVIWIIFIAEFLGGPSTSYHDMEAVLTEIGHDSPQLAGYSYP